LREHLKLLEALQQVDARLHETEEALSSLPAKLQSMKDDVGRIEALLERERQRLAEEQRYRAEIESANREDQELQNKAKIKLQQVRTSKEYMATQRELEVTRKSSQEREEELLKLMSAIEQFQKSIQLHEEELRGLKQNLAEEETETAAKLDKLKLEYRGKKVERDAMTGNIPKDLLARYDSIRQRRGNPVVPARSGVCTGCNMHLPPQLYRILQGGTTIELCPSCHRIVYYEQPENP
jgi:predicted  nucleic acid-binding Zn-ribbon protein